MNTRIPGSDLLHPMFLGRTSPRSFTDEPVTDAEIAAVFEAARWSPSWFNNQPWYFVYETDGADRDAILDVFVEFNRGWAKNAPVVGLIIAKTELEDFNARTRDFDSGIATGALIMQAALLGLSVHLIGGIDLEAAHELTAADPDSSKVICGFVLGHKGDGSDLSEQLREREAPSPRKPVGEFAFKGARLP